MPTATNTVHWIEKAAEAGLLPTEDLGLDARTAKWLRRYDAAARTSFGFVVATHEGDQLYVAALNGNGLIFAEQSYTAEDGILPHFSGLAVAATLAAWLAA